LQHAPPVVNLTNGQFVRALSTWQRRADMTAMPRPRKKPQNTYHHGDLRAAIATVASTIVSEHGSPQLTVRSVGERLGVSHTAVYHHFADRTAILAAVAQHGFEKLTAAIDRAMAAADGALMRYREQGLCYVQFAVRSPRIYALMFGPELAPRSEHPELAQAATDMFGRVRDAVSACQAEGLLSAGPVDEHALFCWSAVHGLSSLIVERQLDGLDLQDRTVAALAEIVADRVFTGLGTRPA
jgi:AcrR family transcriptional regulator